MLSLFKVEQEVDPKKLELPIPIKRNGPIRCLNCQGFEEMKSYCVLLSVCIIYDDKEGQEDLSANAVTEVAITLPVTEMLYVR